MGLETSTIVALASAAASAAAGAASAVSAKNTSEEQMQTANETAAQQLIASKEAAEQQKLLFLKSGVEVTGSPLLTFSETYETGETNADIVSQQGVTAASSTMAQGTSSLLKGLTSGLSQGVSAYQSIPSTTIKKSDITWNK